MSDGAPCGTSRTLTIDCDRCAARASAACRDCIVTFVCARSPGPLEVAAGELRGWQLLDEVGLAPALRLVPAGGGRGGGG